MSSKTHIVRGAGLIQNPLAEMKDIIYDESDVKIANGSISLPAANALGSPIFTDVNATIGNVNMGIDLAYNYKLQSFIYTAIKDTKTYEPYEVHLLDVKREKEIRLKRGVDKNGNQLYITQQVKYRDLVYYTDNIDNGLIITAGGYKIIALDQTYEDVIEYDWNDPTYGNPYNGVIVFRHSFTKIDGGWIAQGEDKPVYFNKNNGKWSFGYQSYARYNYLTDLRYINTETRKVKLRAYTET